MTGEELTVQKTISAVNELLELILQDDNLNAIFKPFLDLEEACQYLGISKPTLYSKTSKNLIPYYKDGKKLYFSKKELDEWVLEKSKRIKPKQEIRSEALLQSLREERGLV